MVYIKLALFSLFSISFAIHSRSQPNVPNTKHLTNLFVGSTPCDSLIRSLLQIAESEPCDFLKWELRLPASKSDSNNFQLTALYGKSKPNTNGFWEGGKKVEIIGNYTTNNGNKNNPRATIYHLHSNQPKVTFSLLEMDINVLHFVDVSNNLIIGNGGWGYVLNKERKR